MSCYFKKTVNPDTHEVEDAEWIDNYFGQHNYGIRFPSTGIIYCADEFLWKQDIAIDAIRAVEHISSKITRVETLSGKDIKTVEHKDGRIDKHIEVKSLDVDLSDPSNAAAKKVIEEEVMPAVANAQITVTIIYKPTNEYASFVCRRVDVRRLANKFAEKRGGEKSEYLLVENDGETIVVTTLV